MNEDSAYKLLVEGTEPTNEKKIKKAKRLTEEEKINILRKSHKINCKSKKAIIPNPVKSFKELIFRYDMPKDFLKCLSSLEYKSLTPVQMQSIPVMIENHNIFTIAPTGSGKTAAFLIPIINLTISLNSNIVDIDAESDVCRPKAIILSPTIELAKQIYQETICLINELDVKLKPKVAFYIKGKILNKLADIVICTPLKLQNTLLKEEQNIIRLDNLKWLVVDESDKMFEDSLNSFSEQFEIIFENIRIFPDCRIAMFSATQNPKVTDWIKTHIETDLIYVRIGVKDAAVETVTQELRYCFSESLKFTEIKNLIINGKFQVPCLVFVDQSKDAQILHDFIREYGLKAEIKVGIISSKLSDSLRRDMITDFREGKIHFLICTNLLARGIDFKGVQTVVNYDLPKLKEDYIHRIGRCGRAGHAGRAISFWTDVDIRNGLPHVLRIMKASNQPVNEELIELLKTKKKTKYYSGDKKMMKLKRKYKSEDGTVKNMSHADQKKKMYLEKCVVRKKFLRQEKLIK